MIGVDCTQPPAQPAKLWAWDFRDWEEPTVLIQPSIGAFADAAIQLLSAEGDHDWELEEPQEPFAEWNAMLGWG